MNFHQLLDLERFPLQHADARAALASDCRSALAQEGLFNLDGLVRPAALREILSPLGPRFATEAFIHARDHNVYFTPDIPGLSRDHPAAVRFTTVNHTLCADQLETSPLLAIYQWQPLVDFLALTLDIPGLCVMDDPLARVNVMQYRQGEALNWHFDRSEFTTTLLLQAADKGGEFQYMTGLRSDDDPNYDGVGAFLNGDQSEAASLSLRPGTLNVFRGRNTAHRVSPVAGDQDRIVAVFSYYDRPGVSFSREERIGFYGRAG